MNPYNIFNNSFIGYYIDNYNDVLNYAAPTDGSAVLFANLNEGMMWSKKIINGVPYVQPYRLMPINNEGRPPEVINTVSTTDQKLDKLIELLGGKINESAVSNEHASESIKK